MKLGLLVFGLALRLVWIMARGLSRDDLTSFSYVFEPGWMSATWDNSPPTFYVFMKALLMVGANRWALRLAAFVVSASTFVLFFRHLEKEEPTFWPLAFWAVYPTSVLNATFRPTIFAELAGVLLYLAIKRGSIPKIGGALVALAASTYLAFVAPLVALGDVNLKKRSVALALAVGAIAAAFGVLFIRWDSLTWLGSNNVFDLVKSSVLMLSQLWGFSLPLFLVIVWVLWRNRALPRSVLAIIFLVFVGPLVTGHQFMSSRFLISLAPWVIASVATVLRLRQDWPARALIVVIPLVTTAWFLIHEKSGWEEAGAFVASSGEEAIFYAPPGLAKSFSPRFNTGELDMDSAIATHLPDGGWILRANPERDVRMNQFLKTGGSTSYIVEEARTFGEKSLEPVRAVKVRARR